MKSDKCMERVIHNNICKSMSYGRPETLTYLIYTRIPLFDRDGQNIQILLSLLAFNIVISSDCPLIRFFVETSPQIRLSYQGF